MRIGFFTPNYPGVSQDGGIGTYTQNLAQALKELGHEPMVLTPGTGPDQMDGRVSVQMTSIRHLPFVDRLAPGAGACWRVARELQRLVRERRIDVVEFPNWEGFGLLFQHVSRTPVVVRLHTSSRETQVIDQVRPTRPLRWDVRRERWQALRATALVTHSHAHRRLMADELGIPAERIHLIPHGVQVYPEFQRPPRIAGPPTIVYLGRLEKRKGTLDLLHAIPQVLAQCPEARFVFIGSDRPHCPGERSHARYLAEEFPFNIQRQVQILGRLTQPEVDRWLQTADIFVAPSLYESFGLIFPEAMRWGTPVIGTRVGGIPEIVTDGETGLLVEQQQPGELAAAILLLAQSADLQRRLGCAGRRHVEENFAVESMARATADLYADVIKQRSRRNVATAR